MFDVGFLELLLIGVVSLIVIGPERLPAVARTVGRWVAKMQRFVRGVRTDIASELETGDLQKMLGDQREQINELRQMVQSTSKEIASDTRAAMSQAKKTFDGIEDDVGEIKQDLTKSGSDSPTFPTPASAQTAAKTSSGSASASGSSNNADAGSDAAGHKSDTGGS